MAALEETQAVVPAQAQAVILTEAVALAVKVQEAVLVARKTLGNQNPIAEDILGAGIKILMEIPGRAGASHGDYQDSDI